MTPEQAVCTQRTGCVLPVDLGPQQLAVWRIERTITIAPFSYLTAHHAVLNTAGAAGSE